MSGKAVKHVIGKCTKPVLLLGKCDVTSLHSQQGEKYNAGSMLSILDGMGEIVYYIHEFMKIRERTE